MPRYYEDLEVGDVYETGSETVTKAEIVDFAEQFDPQPFHVDEEAARDSMFGGLVASGLHTLCLSTRLTVVDVFGGAAGIANMGGAGIDELRWHEPVRPGDGLHVALEVAEKTPSESRSDRGYVDFRRRVITEDERHVMSSLLHNIVERDPEG